MKYHAIVSFIPPLGYGEDRICPLPESVEWLDKEEKNQFCFRYPPITVDTPPEIVFVAG